MKLDKTFSVISRINQSLVLIGLLSMLGLVVWVGVNIYLDAHKARAGEITIKASNEEDSTKKIINITGFRKIQGTDFLMTDITERDPSNHTIYSGSKTTNIMFISSKENKAHLLFPHSKYMINSTNVLGFGSGFNNKDQDTADKAIICQYIKTDTNDNKMLDSHDALSIGLIHPDGTGLVEVLTDVESLLSDDVLDAETLSLIYQKGNKVISARYSLKTFKLLSSTTITDLLAVGNHG